MTLTSHEISPNVHNYSNEELNSIVDKNIALARFRSAWAICEVRTLPLLFFSLSYIFRFSQVLREDSAWIRLGQAALKSLDIELASRVFRQVSNGQV